MRAADLFIPHDNGVRIATLQALVDVYGHKQFNGEAIGKFFALIQSVEDHCRELPELNPITAN